MKLSPNQLHVLAKKILEQWKASGVAELKADEKVVLERIVALMKGEIQKEIDLDRAVHAMLDQLERSHGGEFERHKMFHLLKNKMAKEKKVIL
jgi:hypothetical protein